MNFDFKQRFRHTHTPTHTEKGIDEKGNEFFKRVNDAPVDVTVELQIDLLALVRQLAARACKSKSRKSILAGGIIRVIKITP